jgi:LmbE family N-acetylglucosaminyl deacetylase
MSEILIIASHPDDEMLGCGGTIFKHKENDDNIYLCIVTGPHKPYWTEAQIRRKKKEIESMYNLVGYKKIFTLNYPAAKLDTIPLSELNSSLLDVIKNINPDIVYIPYKYDLHKDHRLIFESSIVVTRPYISKAKILSYEVPSETEWGFKVFKPNIYIEMKKDYIIKKYKTLKHYSGQTKKFPYPRSKELLFALARKRGSECNTRYAEAFQLIREII